MNLKNKSLWKVDVKTIVAIGIGAALFFVSDSCLFFVRFIAAHDTD